MRVASRSFTCSGFIRAACLVLFCVVALLASPLACRAAVRSVPPPPPSTFSMEQLKAMAEKRTRTGVSSDAIPALYRPSFLSVSDASLSMEHDEPVFIVQYSTGLVRIYPQRIMVWHEVVNDVLPDPSGAPLRKDTPLSALDGFCITYSPLTGTVTAFYAVAGRFPTTFGTSGELLNANSLLYDRASQSLWSQLTATCIDGLLMGKRLSRIPVLWAKWSGAAKRYPDAQVLSRSTGYRRTYGKDPYGSYSISGNYYDDLRLLHPLTRFDNRLPPKRRILGLELEGAFGAVDKEEVRKVTVANVALGVTPLAAIYDTELDAVRIFDRRLPGTEDPLRFILFEGRIQDEQSRSDWNSEGLCISGRFRGQRLPSVLAIDSMWFAWAAFYPQSVILPEKTFVRPMPGSM